MALALPALLFFVLNSLLGLVFSVALFDGSTGSSLLAPGNMAVR